jgi:N-methylhydantoinase A
MVDIHTIGAGGGSIAWSDHGALRVGPQSAGASPGPACYGRGGEAPTVTDANLVLGRIKEDNLFGGSIRLHVGQARAAVGRIGAEFGLGVEAAAEGVLDVINAKMANAIRTMTVSRGIDPRDFAIVAYGGAGPMHAAFIAEELGVEKIIVPNLAGAFSAWGMLQTEGRHDLAQTLVSPLEATDWNAIRDGFAALRAEIAHQIDSEILSAGRVAYGEALDLRYVGQEYFLTVQTPRLPTSPLEAQDLRTRFDDIYERRFGHCSPDAKVEVVNLRLQASYTLHGAKIAVQNEQSEPRPYTTRRTMFGSQWCDCPFWRRDSMDREAVYHGPLVVEEASCTTVVTAGFTLHFDPIGNMILKRAPAE